MELVTLRALNKVKNIWNENDVKSVWNSPRLQLQDSSVNLENDKLLWACTPTIAILH
jgi:hypothetical protein